MNKRKKGIIATVIFTLVAILYVSPLFIVLMNSFKKKAFINLEPFKLPSEKTFIGAENYVNAVDKYGFLQAVIWTVVITVGSVLVILLCTSMFAWYITRVKSSTTEKKVRRGEQPSIMAASSISMGMDLTKPQNMNTASPAPKPR